MGFGDVADFLAHQGCADGRFQRDLACFEIHLVRADDLEGHACVRREVREFDLAQKADPVFRKGFGVDYAGMVQNLLQETDTADGLRLESPRFTVSRILAAVALRTCLREVLPYIRVDHIDKVVQLGHDLVVSLFR